MPGICNDRVYGLAESIYRSGYPMMEEPPALYEYEENVEQIEHDILTGNYTNPHIARAIKLANAKGGGHDQFLTGIVVNFDLTFSNKAWAEAERYKFLNFISSASTMHRISRMNISDCCNLYTSNEAIMTAIWLQEEYNAIDDSEPEAKKTAYLRLLYNLPAGFELTAGMTTNYRCLKNIYAQRRSHRLPDWQLFCDWIETLSMAGYLITGEAVKK